MSMLSSQCAELRGVARMLRTFANGLFAPHLLADTRDATVSEMRKAASEMEQAADTIESLRDRLQICTLGRGECELHGCDGSFSAVNRPVWRCDCGAFMTQYTDATTYHMPRYCPNCGKRVKR